MGFREIFCDMRAHSDVKTKATMKRSSKVSPRGPLVLKVLVEQTAGLTLHVTLHSFPPEKRQQMRKTTSELNSKTLDLFTHIHEYSVPGSCLGPHWRH